MSRYVAVLLVLLAVLAGFYLSFPRAERIVVYCALDREFAAGILDEFSRSTGIHAVVRWDSEANKSVGLYEDLIREKDRPRCDVHWNNELLATIRLGNRGVLQPHERLDGRQFMLAAQDHTWTGFAARARVIVFNTNLVDERIAPKGMEDLTHPRWKSKFAMAKPQFGTTATQAACLFEVWGSEKAKEFYHGLKHNGVLILPGNKQVAEAVGSGKIAVGLTDTDDAFAEVDAGRPVGICYLDFAGEGGVDCPQMIPNTVAIVRGCPNPSGARKLVDYLLTREVETRLAKAPSRQYPLGADAPALPDWGAFIPLARRTEVGRLKWLDFSKAADRWLEAQEFLAKLFELR